MIMHGYLKGLGKAKVKICPCAFLAWAPRHEDV